MLLSGARIEARDKNPPPFKVKAQSSVKQEAPPLPAGLQEEEGEPALPAGLQEEEEEPSLPAGLDAGDEEEAEKPASKEEGALERFRASLPFDLNGFLDARGGIWLKSNSYEKDPSLAETRLQLEAEKQWTNTALNVTVDFLYDPLANSRKIDLYTGEGWLDLREASFSFTPVAFADFKVGRQILTWGTGDLIFINDLFPKDWNSFLLGRDVEYLKAPGDALKGSFFSDAANLDIVYTPRFQSDRFIDGTRISFYNPALGEISGRDDPVNADVPNEWFRDDEIALRLYRMVEEYELALYGYHGFWKSPAGMEPAAARVTFPPLSVLGLSGRGHLAKGIGNVEAGYYASRGDTGGSDPLVRNSEFRFLAGYEQEVATDFNAGLQYYLEWMMNHGNYERNLPPGAPAADEFRHLLTLRLTRLLMNQNLTLSLFTFYSPSDQDAYFRPKVHYKVDDRLMLETGVNWFIGKYNYTFFGQFENNTNVYVAIRYSF